MEAPETIFVNNLGYGCLSEPCTERMFVSQIEYVRKDVFIKKVCEFINNANLYLYHCIGEECDLIDTDKMIEDFKKTI